MTDPLAIDTDLLGYPDPYQEDHDMTTTVTHGRAGFTAFGAHQRCACGWVGQAKRGEPIAALAGEMDNHREIPEHDSAFGYCVECDAPVTVEGSRRCSPCGATKEGF